MWVYQKYGITLIIRNFIQSEQRTNLTLLLPTIDDYMDEILNMIDEVQMWVHWKYIVSWSVQKLYLFKTNKCTYLAVPDGGWLN